MEKAIKMRKRGQINDILFIIVFLTSVSITLLLAGFIYYEAQPVLTDPTYMPAESITAYNAFSAAFPMFDASLTMVTLALTIGLIISALFIPTNAIFIVVNIVGLAPLIFLGAVFSNLYGTILEENGTATTMALVAQQNYPITTFTIVNLPYFCIGLVLIVSIVMYAKRQREY